jgi:hypothetical protein
MRVPRERVATGADRQLLGYGMRSPHYVVYQMAQRGDLLSGRKDQCASRVERDLNVAQANVGIRKMDANILPTGDRSRGNGASSASP